MCVAYFLLLLPVKPRAAFRGAYTATFSRHLNQTAKETGVDALQRSPALCQSVSRAAAGFHVAVAGGAFVNRALVLQRGLVFAWRRPAGGFTAVLIAVEEVDGKTDDHPDGEAAPRPNVQLHHEVDVDENAEQGQPRQQGDLEGESLFALRLPPDDDDADATEQSQNDTGHHDACMSAEQLVQIVGQDNAQNDDENRDNSGGSVDDVPRGLCWGFSTRTEEQLGGEGLSERPLVRLHAVFVAAVSSAYGHLLSLHQLHQLLRLAG